MLLVKLIEPPCTERYARWCERSGNLVKFPSYSILKIGAVREAGYRLFSVDEKEPKVDLYIPPKRGDLQ